MLISNSHSVNNSHLINSSLIDGRLAVIRITSLLSAAYQALTPRVSQSVDCSRFSLFLPIGDYKRPNSITHYGTATMQRDMLEAYNETGILITKRYIS